MDSGESERIDPRNHLKTMEALSDVHPASAGDEPRTVSFLKRTFEERFPARNPADHQSRKPGGTQSVPSYGLEHYASSGDEGGRLDEMAAKELHSIIESASGSIVEEDVSVAPEYTISSSCGYDPETGAVSQTCTVSTDDGVTASKTTTSVTDADFESDGHVLHVHTIEKHVISHQEKDAVIHDVVSHIAQQTVFDQQIGPPGYPGSTSELPSGDSQRVIKESKVSEPSLEKGGFGEGDTLAESAKLNVAVPTATIPSLVLLPVDPQSEVLDWWWLISPNESHTRNRVLLQFQPQFLKIMYKFMHMPAIRIPLSELSVEIPKSRKPWRRKSVRRVFIRQGLAKLELLAALKCDRDRFISRLADASSDPATF